MIRRRWDAALGVAYLVSGSVGRPGRSQSPGVTVELLRASDGMHVWGGQYESRDHRAPVDSGSRRARGGDDHHGRAPAGRADGAGEPAAARSRSLRSLLRANYQLAQRTPRACATPLTSTRARCGSTRASRPRSPGRHRLRAVPRLGVGISRPVAGGRAGSRVRCGGPRPATGFSLRRRVDGKRLPPQLPESAYLRGRARGAASRHRARSAERGGTSPVRDGAALAGPRLRRRCHVPPGASPSSRSGRSRCSISGVSPRGRPATRRPVAGRTALWRSILAADYAYVLRAVSQFRLGNPAEARADAETAARLRAGFRVPGEAVLRSGAAWPPTRWRANPHRALWSARSAPRSPNHH